jgi:Skp family chaperone for outer membrane proteins
MNKEDIKSLLREALGMQRPMESMVPEAEGNEDEKGDKNYDELNDKQKKKVQTLTKKIKNATQGAGKLLKLSQVMDAAGVGDADNATDRSAIGKAVSGKPDADGKTRHLSVKQANAMGKVVDNPVAFK